MAAPTGSNFYTPPHGAPSRTFDSSSSSSRKRSLGPTDFPEPKRLSARPSPVAPSTPNTFFDDAAGLGGSQQWTLPSRPSVSGPIIDLTVSDPPTPDTFPDPFPELENAYREVDARPTPADAFNQDFTQSDELAQFMMAATAAGGGYAFQPPGQPAQLNFLDFAVPNVPYLPGPQKPAWAMESDSEEYGDFPLNEAEAGAIEKLLENIKEHGETPDDREPTPQIMCSTLKEYQKIGLTWLLKMENGVAKGGILADEMGLGKTVQALSLICARPSTDPLCKTTLIIAPVALMRQWEKEIERHIHPRSKLSVYLYWGKGKKADFQRLRQYDVVLTTFGTLTSESKQKESRRESMLCEREMREPGFRRKAQDKLALLGHECMWYRVIIDEAHAIKNRNTAQSKASVDIQARHRLCMTGTPMMNSVDELYPLLRFLRVSPYNNWHKFNQDIGKPVKQGHPETRKRAMNRVQILLKTVMMRRQKTSVVDGKQICTIPPKHTTLDNVEFSDDEHMLYKALESKAQIQFNRYVEGNSVSANYANVLVLLLRLRQACCHPHLIKDLSQPATEGIAEDDLLTRAETLREDVVERLKAAESDSFECPVCLEADPNPTIIIPCGHTVCGECVQKLIDPTRTIVEGNEEGSTAKCPHCRGELKARLITDYKHFCKVHCPEKLSPEPEDERADSVDSDSDDESEDEDAKDVDNKGNLAGFVVSDNEDDDYEAVEADGGDDSSAQEASAKPLGKKLKRKNGKGKARSKPTKTLAQLKKESLRSKAAKKRYIRRLEKTFVASAKTEKVVELVSEIMRNDPTEKTLIFSQFTSLLDLLEVPLSQKQVRYQRYDGSMKMDERADAVNAFMDNPDDNVMLVSLKAGNAGLNLWKASQVIILDPFWNPFVEEQAVDRAHRMPQPREVTVHRVLVPETVEDRICLLQDKKREIIGAALDEQASKNLTRLNVQELKFLFGLN
ncbi:SNF2 family N-terminal domain-containing protein [Pyrenochaeta sp. MPI-SDFR-AT-0127]|nr:SNF2 family N-terminal domain-containing protein [Pyrenochaeta sp. MPI-SDFR-AT-0127]